MKNVNALLKKPLSDDSGQDLIEYSLIGALIALAAISAISKLGTRVSSEFNKVGSSLSRDDCLDFSPPSGRRRGRRRLRDSMARSDLVANLERNAIVSRLKAGTTLFRRGDPVTAVYLIWAGRIALECDTPDGVAHLEIMGPSGILGLPAAFNGSYSITARADEDCELGFVPSDWVMELFRNTPRLLMEASGLISQEVARMRNIMSRMRG